MRAGKSCRLRMSKTGLGQIPSKLNTRTTCRRRKSVTRCTSANRAVYPSRVSRAPSREWHECQAFPPCMKITILAVSVSCKQKISVSMRIAILRRAPNSELAAVLISKKTPHSMRTNSTLTLSGSMITRRRSNMGPLLAPVSSLAWIMSPRSEWLHRRICSPSRNFLKDAISTQTCNRR